MVVELEQRLSSRERVLSLNDAISLTNKLRENHLIAVTTGAFDLLHIGHLRYLEMLVEIASQASAELRTTPFVLIGINSDESVRRNKGVRTNNRPVMTELERGEIIAGLRGVNRTFVFDNDWDLIKLLPNMLQVFTGSDNKPGDRPEVTYLKEHGTRIVTIESELQRPGATTSIIEKIHTLNIR